MREVNNLLDSLDSEFRRDLAMVCESHHRSDLDNFNKYRVIKPYGNSDAETANLLYAAILLRASDLLHITRDRTPSVQFRVINPTDPISQEEWAKQAAVRRVCDKCGLNSNREPDENAPRDTIIVYATFAETTGFFGLTSYLNYAEDQLKQCFEWSQLAKRRHPAKHDFPWRSIDQSQISATGFVPVSFQFTIDERKILDLLTGHTLYNDTDVVLRELAQNSLDAVRLHFWQDRGAAAHHGYVRIHWNSTNRTLTVSDNGTGMSQQIIENHLLRVGSSRYQDSRFKEQYPDFSPISRFGIGVLSTFMIADEVEIVTSHPDDPEARQLTLRSVHGKYLIRLLDKKLDSVAKEVADHGTIVRLRLRPTAKVDDILAIARKWIVVPGARVEVQTDDHDPVCVGYPDVEHAVKGYLEAVGYTFVGESGSKHSETVSVMTYAQDGLSGAFAVRWSRYFKNWSFMGHERDFEGGSEAVAGLDPTGICIEGVRVMRDTPGYEGRPVLALVNCTGPGAPQTNVARSSVDWTAAADDTLRRIYLLYARHIVSEFERLRDSGEYSLTWALEEAAYLMAPLFFPRRNSIPLSNEALREALYSVPVLAVERDGHRVGEAPQVLRSREGFWTIDSPLFRSAEYIIREIPGGVSLAALRRTLFPKSADLPNGDIVCGRALSSDYYPGMLDGYEIKTVHVIDEERRVDCEWSREAVPPRWLDTEQIVRWMEGGGQRARALQDWLRDHVPGELYVLLVRNLRDEFAYTEHFERTRTKLLIQVGEVDTDCSDTLLVKTQGRTLVLLDAEARRALEMLRMDGTVAAQALLFLLVVVLWGAAHSPRGSPDIAHVREAVNAMRIESGLRRSFEMLGQSITKRMPNIFSPELWLRGSGSY